MGSTHFRSDVREKGARTASFSTVAAGVLTCDSLVNAGTVTQTGLSTNTGGVSIPTTSYLKMGSIYLISGALPGGGAIPTNASINVIASTALTGVVATKGDIPRGSIFLNNGTGCVASNIILVKVQLASWSGISGTIIQD